MTIQGTNKADSINLQGRTPFEDEYISVGNGNDTVTSGGGNDQIYGENGNDDLNGYIGNDYIYGGNGNDNLKGGNNNDYLNGERGNDTINGGFGVDLLTGGKGGDVFTFGSIGAVRGTYYFADSGVGEGLRDVIFDFDKGEDIIDLSLMNFSRSAGPSTPGYEIPSVTIDLEFEFIGTSDFTPGGGLQPQLRYFVVDGITIIQMDGVDPRVRDRTDGFVDAEIELIGEFTLTSDNFIL